MIIDTEKDCGIWVEFIDEEAGRITQVSWKGLGTGKTHAEDDLVSAISVIISVFILQNPEEWKPRELSHFYGKIMNTVANFLHKGEVEPACPLKLMTEELENA